MKRGWGALVAILVMVASITPALTTARFSSHSQDLGSAFSVGAFTPTVSPTPTVGVEGSSVRVQWPIVTFPGSSTVAYRVRKTTNNSQVVEVCTGSLAPQMIGREITCLDPTLTTGSSSTYAVQAFLLRNGTTTWSLPFGSESSPVALTALSFAGAGVVVNTTQAGLVSVPYPSGTKPSDLLILMVVHGRNRSPMTPSGWTQVMSSGVSGSQDFNLYVAWRLADAGSAASVEVDGRNEGTSLQMFRYTMPAGSAAPNIRVAQGQSGSSLAASATLLPSPDIATNAPAVAMSFVAVRAENDLRISSGSGWVLRSAAKAKPGRVSLSWAIADVAVGTAATVKSPTWSQSGSPVPWLFGGSAFG